MKISNVFLIIMLVFAQSLWANTNIYKPGGTPLEKYTIVYAEGADDNEGLQQAIALQARLQELSGKQNILKNADEIKKGPVISIGKLSNGGTFDYSVTAKHGKVSIEGGSSWAIDRASKEFVDYVRKHPVTRKFELTGSVEGEVLFNRQAGANLRILDDNVWEYSQDTVPQVWQKAGIDCRDAARVPEFVQIARAYMPDVLVLQEYSRHFDSEFNPRIEKYGYRNARKSSKQGDWNNTPVFYNVDSLELVNVNYHLYRPSEWSNRGTKSFTSAVFRQKSTGKTFAVINTHLWWKGDAVQPGSTFARTAQVNLILAEAEIIRHRYDCPIFITGDMNCEENSMPMQTFINAGCVPCHKAATVYGNKDNGHHICAPGEVGVRTSRRKGPDRETGAIDHCFILNGKDAEIKVFDCIQDYFTVKLTDHYPNLIDATL